VTVYVNNYAVGQMTWQTRLAALTASMASLTAFDKQGCASPITARLIRNGQAYRAMRVKFPARVLNRPDPTTVGNHNWNTCLIGTCRHQVRSPWVRMPINLQQPISSTVAAQSHAEPCSTATMLLEDRIIV
jgi:hypothetical protein